MPGTSETTHSMTFFAPHDSRSQTMALPEPSAFARAFHRGSGMANEEKYAGPRSGIITHGRDAR